MTVATTTSVGVLSSRERALIQAVRSRVPLALRRRVESLLDGDHDSVHVGRSLDFNDLRAYAPGDDVKDVDWKATARRGELLIRRHVAQRQATLMVGMCGTPTMRGWSDMDVTKAHLAAVVTAIMAQIAVDHGDRVAMVCTGPDGTSSWRPTVRLPQVERMLHEIIEFETASGSQDPHVVETVLATATNAMRRPGLLLLIRDDDDITSAQANALSRAAVRHDVIVVTLTDMLATDRRLAGRAIMAADGGRSVMEEVLGDRRLREAAASAQIDLARRSDAMLDDLGIAHARVQTVAEAPEALAMALSRRGRR
ncbi:DUF58 domain-containing protein [Cutibacterium sp. WCA-380-WT-3A]|uniref:DUF58 domain-containing protein n=1 Tax=Cutibacterium porci TaxID=2605781 RepID=A0A7K0J809_9ACTN|nr:DUF58 domain-containing protein [Cutibacterium porci]MSS46085.1 DUF58 domain-containing protein [Cutibacterium porci]